MPMATSMNVRQSHINPKTNKLSASSPPSSLNLMQKLGIGMREKVHQVIRESTDNIS